MLSSWRLLPQQPGIYIYKDDKGQILYVGKAKSLRDRVSSYFQSSKNLGPKTQALVAKIDKIDFIVVESEIEALLLEANLIKEYSPQYNIDWKDGKAYPFIKITSDEYPAVVQSRKMDDKKAVYFGPYPNIGNVRSLLKLVRRIFPYSSMPNHAKRVCLYHHLGLCPCPPVFDSPELKKEYRRNIRLLEKFLEGKKDDVKKQLEKEMKEAANNEEFEKAKNIKKQLDTIDIITRPVQNPHEYIKNPNLVSDQGQLAMDALKKELQSSGLAIENLSRIECYDISNTSGKEAVGSMVVATNGIIDKSQYRRFKIYLKNTPDDFSMHAEVASRRLKHLEDWGRPDLLVIDGGAGQVGAVLKVLEENNEQIAVIGLAKRMEEIYVPKSLTDQSSLTGTRNDKYEDFTVLRLPRADKGLQLLQRLRDEAHRFAITYHRKLRAKKFLEKK